MRAHVIVSGKVENTIVVPALDSLPGLTLIDADLHPGKRGDTWNGSVIIPDTSAEDSLEQERAARIGRANSEIRSETELTHLRKELDRHLLADDAINAIRTLDKIYQREKTKEV